MHPFPIAIQTERLNPLHDDHDRYNRVVVEMFDHIANWRAPLTRIRDWLERDGRVFLHVFSHRGRSYRFDANDPNDWVAHHVFTGGIMPARDFLSRMTLLLAAEDEWGWSGEHCRRTALDWIANFDRQRTRINEILREVYRAEASLWRRRWRLLFLASAGLFGHAGSSEWGGSHYRLRA